jgi:hypothetical protein
MLLLRDRDLRVSFLEDNVNALIRSLALAVAFGTTAAAASAKTAQPAPEPVKTAQSAPDASGNATVAAPAAAAPTHDQHAISGRRSDSTTDAEAIAQQLRFRVLMPPLSGDGGS